MGPPFYTDHLYCSRMLRFGSLYITPWISTQSWASYFSLTTLLLKIYLNAIAPSFYVRNWDGRILEYTIRFPGSCVWRLITNRDVYDVNCGADLETCTSGNWDGDTKWSLTVIAFSKCESHGSSCNLLSVFLIVWGRFFNSVTLLVFINTDFVLIMIKL
jgi:hypothetical protein